MPKIQDTRKLDKLKAVLELLQNDTLKPSDVKQFLLTVSEIVKKTKGEMESLTQNQKKEIKLLVKQLKDQSTLDSLENSKMTLSAKKEFDLKIKEATKLVKELQAIEIVHGEDGEDGLDGSPDTAKDIKKKLETLMGSKRLSMKAIDGLTDELDFLEKKINKKVEKAKETRIYGGGGGKFLKYMRDVDQSLLVAATDGQALVYDDTLGKWKPGTVSGGSSFGTDNQIPYTNATGDDFDYSANFTYDHANEDLLLSGTSNPGIYITHDSVTAGLLIFTQTTDAVAGISYLESDAVNYRRMLTVESDVVKFSNRASNGKIEFYANNATAGAAGEFLALTVEDDLITSEQIVELKEDLRFNGTNEITTLNGYLIINPEAGSGVSMNLLAGGPFSINNSQLYLDTTNGYLGINEAAPATELHLVGRMLIDPGDVSSPNGRRMIDAVQNSNSAVQDYYPTILVRNRSRSTGGAGGNSSMADIGFFADDGVLKGFFRADGLGDYFPAAGFGIAGTTSHPFYINVADTNQFTLNTDGSTQLAAYGGGTITGTATYHLGVDVNGNIIEEAIPTGYTNLTSFVDQTAWRVFYSNGSGDVTELALGADGTYLQSNGAALAPSWSTPAGSGDVSKVGTPVDNQVGVWTGDGTIEGTTGLTYDGSNFQLTGDIGSTGTRITKGWFTDLTVTNDISGSITGNAATATALETSRTLWGQSFDGTANIADNITIGTGAAQANVTTNGSQNLLLDTGHASSSEITLTDGIIVINPVSASDLVITTTGSVRSGTNNATSLGRTNVGWSDLYLGTGGVITWNSAPSTPDITLTHSLNLLTFNGGTFAMGTNNLTVHSGTWDSNGIDLASGDTYQIAGTDVLSATTLGTNVVSSSLTSVGTLTALQVDNININGNVISSTDTNGNITLTPNGTGNVDIGNFQFDADQTVGVGQDNYVLTYDNGTGLISLEVASGGGASQLSDLSDVNTSTPTNRFVLVADGVDFESRLLVEADISDLGTYSTDIHANISALDAVTGTNTGDQTSIVGITGTKAQFDTAVTDGNFMYIGDAPTAHTHTVSELSDLGATQAELDILDLSATALTTGWGYFADGASAASWRQLLGSEISNTEGWTSFTPTDIDTDYGNETVTSDWTFTPNGTGALADIDLTIGGANYGMLEIGNSLLGRTNRVNGNMDLDGTLIIENKANPSTSNILFAMMDGTNSIRFALPQSGVGNATYNPRSMLLAGPTVNDDEVVTVGYWQTNNSIFDNLACDTNTDGADLGVQNDLEVEGDIFTDSIKGSTDNTDIVIAPHGTGNITLGNFTFDADQSVGVGQDNYVLTYDNGTGFISLEAATGGSGNTLDQAYDEGGAGSGRSITASDGAVEITVSDTSNNAGLIINQNDTTNDPTALELIVPDGHTGANALTITSNSNGSIGAWIKMVHDSTTANGGDSSGLDFYFDDDGQNQFNAGYFYMNLVDSTNTAEDTSFRFYVTQAGTTDISMLQIGEDNGTVINGLSIGSGSGASIITSRGNQDLTLQTGNATTGTITITDGAGGDITLSPNGAGDVVLHTITVDSSDNLTAPGGGTIQGFTSIFAGNGDSFFTIYDDNNDELMKFSLGAGSVVNEFTVTGGTTGNAPTFEATGGDTDIGIDITPKGAGNISLGTMTFDSDQTIGAGQDNYILTYDNGTGLISLEAASGGGANTALSNLSAVAINSSLLFDTDATYDIGSTTVGINDLHLGSGGVINFDNGDITITHSLNDIAIAGGTMDLSGLTGNITFANATDLVWNDISNGVTIYANGTSDGGLTINGDTGGGLVLSNPNGNTEFSDLTTATALVSVGTITTGTWNATAITDTYLSGISLASGSLTLSGADALTLTTTAATNVTLPTTGTLMANLLEDTTPQLGGDLDANGNNITDVHEIRLDAIPDTDHTANGPTTNSINAGATIAIGELVYLGTGGKWLLTDADAASSAGPVMLGVALEAGTDTNPMLVALAGSFVRDDTWAWTVGAELYVSTTPGDFTETAPSGTDDVIRVVGYAVSADVIYFNPGTSHITHV